jgi:hypothetical protein
LVHGDDIPEILLSGTADLKLFEEPIVAYMEISKTMK